MKVDEVPQDENQTYQGYGKKAVYAVNDGGRITKTTTSGWLVEEVILRDVVADFEEQAAEIKTKVLNGHVSPIAWFMCKRFLDVPLVSSALGISRWRVKRHLKPKIFKKLKPQLIEQYAELFRIEVDALIHFKEDTTVAPDS